MNTSTTNHIKRHYTSTHINSNSSVSKLSDKKFHIVDAYPYFKANYQFRSRDFVEWNYSKEILNPVPSSIFIQLYRPSLGVLETTGCDKKLSENFIKTPLKIFITIIKIFLPDLFKLLLDWI